MKVFIGICIFFLCAVADGLPRYWIVEQDFLKIGKKELYEEEKRKQILEENDFLKKRRKPQDLVAAQDLENPQYVFFRPVKDLGSLELYEPLKKESFPLVNTCLNFKIFSLHEVVEDSSFLLNTIFQPARGYFSYVLYDIAPGSEKSFEEHFTSIKIQQPKDSSASWICWKVLFGADSPKYLIFSSFSGKAEMKEFDPDVFFKEILIRDIIRDKRTGWLKRQDFISLGKK